MNNSVNDFIDKYYYKSIELKKRFKITEKKNWNIFTILSEFFVQLGHLSLLISDYKLYAEKNRKINDIDDEISDVIFQLINIDHKLNNSLLNKEYNYKFIKLESISDYILNINILIGQLSESLLENNKYRHYKIRYDYPNINDYINNLL